MQRSRLWLLPVLLAALVAGGWYFGFRAKESDRELPVYVTGAERMLAGEEIYRRGTDAKPFTYPPFAAVPFVPVAALPAAWQPPVWFGVNFFVLVLLARWLHRWSRRPDPAGPAPGPVAYWALLLLIGGHHVASVLANQSHDLLIAGVVALTAAAWCRGGTLGWILAGCWAGAGAAIKATPMLFVGLFSLRRRIAAVVAMTLAIAALTLLPDLLFPRSDGRLWATAWFDVNLRGLQVGGTADAAGAWNAHSYLNQSLSGALVRLFTPVRTPGAFVDEHAMLVELSPGAFRAVSILMQLLVLGGIALGIRCAARAEANGGEPAIGRRTFGLAEVAMIACGMVLLSPQSSKSHFCVWLFPAAFLADRLLRARRDVVLWVIVAVALVLGPLASKGIVGREVGNKLLAFGNVTWCTVLLLVGVIWACRGAARPPAPR